MYEACGLGIDTRPTRSCVLEFPSSPIFSTPAVTAPMDFLEPLNLGIDTDASGNVYTAGAVEKNVSKVQPPP